MNAPSENGQIVPLSFGIGRGEFIAMIAAIMALNALAIDIMLPGMQQIGASLGEPDENRRQFVITSYLIGFSLMQLVFGPISDRYGRRGPLAVGIILYVTAAISATFVPSFAPLLALRFIQGMGAAATRVIAVAIVRDVFGGRKMAEVMSLVMTVFMVMPIVSPSLGQVIMLYADWQMVFIFMAAIAALILAWMWQRLPETLAFENRRPLSIKSVAAGFKFVMTTRISFCYSLAMAIVMGSLFGFINQAQQIYVGIYDLGAWFPIAFAAVAGMMSLAAFSNSKLVVRFGMRRVSHFALIGFTISSSVIALLASKGDVNFWIFGTLFSITMILFGMIGSNFTSIGMEPLGALAGTASSVQGFLQTFGGATIGGVIGQTFDGTVFPISVSFALVGIASLCCVLIAEKGRLLGT